MQIRPASYALPSASSIAQLSLPCKAHLGAPCSGGYAGSAIPCAFQARVGARWMGVPGRWGLGSDGESLGAVAVASVPDLFAVQPNLCRAEKRANVRERIAAHHQQVGPFSRLDGAEVCESSAGFGGMTGAGDDDVHGR